MVCIVCNVTKCVCERERERRKRETTLYLHFSVFLFDLHTYYTHCINGAMTLWERVRDLHGIFKFRGNNAKLFGVDGCTARPKFANGLHMALVTWWAETCDHYFFFCAIFCLLIFFSIQFLRALAARSHLWKLRNYKSDFIEERLNRRKKQTNQERKHIEPWSNYSRDILEANKYKRKSNWKHQMYLFYWI